MPSIDSSENAGYTITPPLFERMIDGMFSLDTVIKAAGLALFVIGCVGAAGVFPGSNIGWITVGLTGGMLVLRLFSNKSKSKSELILAALVATALLTVGTLGITGILSSTQVGWGIVGTGLAKSPIVLSGCVKPLEKRRVSRGLCHTKVTALHRVREMGQGRFELPTYGL